MEKNNFIKVSESFYVLPEFKKALEAIGLKNIDGVFSFSNGENLHKKDLCEHRSRLQIKVENPIATLFLKRYKLPPFIAQIRNWVNSRSFQSIACCEADNILKLSSFGIRVPQVVGFGEEKAFLFEKRSFLITNKIPNAESLEKKLPDYFQTPITNENIKLRKDFIYRLAEFVRKFHQSGYRHRDLYLCHIFYDGSNQFHMIDLARVFKPMILSERFRIKDLAQLYYSAPGSFFSKSDRIKFYLCYTGQSRLSQTDKRIIARIKRKVKRIAAHDKKHGGTAPFES